MHLTVSTNSEIKKIAWLPNSEQHL
jgi:hypothetical protein